MQVTRVAPDWPVPSLMRRRRVLADCITYVGLDVHKEWIVVAIAEVGGRGEVREDGRLANTTVGRPGGSAPSRKPNRKHRRPRRAG